MPVCALQGGCFSFLLVSKCHLWCGFSSSSLLFRPQILVLCRLKDDLTPADVNLLSFASQMKTGIVHTRTWDRAWCELFILCDTGVYCLVDRSKYSISSMGTLIRILGTALSCSCFLSSPQLGKGLCMVSSVLEGNYVNTFGEVTAAKQVEIRCCIHENSFVVGCFPRLLVNSSDPSCSVGCAPCAYIIIHLFI